MNGKDKISVIIPCYNVQKYIMRCFDSIYSQTYGFENLEVILIDDLSTDNTWSILESLQRQYPENGKWHEPSFQSGPRWRSFCDIFNAF